MPRTKKKPRPKRQPRPPRWKAGDRVTTRHRVVTRKKVFRDNQYVALTLLPGCVWEVKEVRERRCPRRRLAPLYVLAVRAPNEYLIERTEGRLRPLRPGEGEADS